MICNKNISSNDEAIYQTYREYISEAYPTFLHKLGITNVAFKAVGATIIDSMGKEYIDCIGGYGIYNLGHNHPVIVESIISYLRENHLQTKPLISEISTSLAESLACIAPGDLACSFVCNSGSEAIDSALKLARMVTRKKHIISANKSFHGYTFGALSVSGIPSFKRSFEPMVPEISHVQYGDCDDLIGKITSDTAAVLLEPIQHEAGINLPPHGYFQEVRRICDKNKIILIIDEVKTAFGKTGYMFASELYGILPDILVVGKSLGGGLIPIGALIAQKNMWKKFSLSFPMSASSYAGNGLACRAALTTIMLLTQSDVMNECRVKSTLLIKKLRKFPLKFPTIIKDVNGVRFLIGIETLHPSKAMSLSTSLIRDGVLAVPAFAHSSTIMIEPPIVISYDQVDRILKVCEKACYRLTSICEHV